MTANEIKNMLANLKSLEIKSDEADAAYEADPENLDAEAAFDKAYNEEFSALSAVVAGIVSLTKGKISPAIARKMVLTRREDIENLVSL